MSAWAQSGVFVVGVGGEGVGAGGEGGCDVGSEAEVCLVGCGGFPVGGFVWVAPGWQAPMARLSAAESLRGRSRRAVACVS